MYKMYLISAEGYKNADVHFLKVRKTGEIWPSMKNSGSGMSVKNISDLVLKEIYGKFLSVQNLKSNQKQESCL